MTERAESSKDDRLRQLETLTHSALAHLDVEELLEELLRRLQEVLEVDAATVLVVDADAGQLIPVAAAGAEVSRSRLRIPLGQGFAGRVMAERRPLILERVDATTAYDPVLWESGLRSLLGVPLLVAGAVTGVLHVGTHERRQFNREDTALLQLVADRVALATQARVTRAERAAATALQRGLLPAGLPNVPGFEVATRYVPGADGVGGDWYDLFVLPSGQLGLVIGDVLGRGLHAAVVMGRLRSALRAYALEFDDPAVVLAKLDRKAQLFEGGMMATVLYAIVDPSRGRVRLSSGGHLPPVLALPGQPAQVLDLPVDLTLGVQLGLERHTVELEFPPGALLCLYTDGLIERRGSSLDADLERLGGAVDNRPPEILCTELMAKFVGAEPTDDDIAMVAMRRAADGQ